MVALINERKLSLASMFKVKYFAEVMHPQNHFTLNFLSMKYFLSKIFRTTVVPIAKCLLLAFALQAMTPCNNSRLD